MKPTLLFATLSLVFASPTAFAKSELEALRSRCAEQERQIQQLEEENMKLRGTPTKSSPSLLGSQTELISTSAAKPIPATRSVEPANASTASETSVYTVKAGDSLEKIARKVGSSPASLAKINGLKTNSMLHPNQTLKIPAGAAISPSSTPASPEPAAVSSPIPGKTYKVANGDTYSSIARKTQTSVESLIAANPSVKPTGLRTGQIISLSGEKQVASTASRPVSAPAPKTPAPTSAPKSEPVSQTAATSSAGQELTSPTPEKKIRPISIEGEMTYGEFASQHGTSTERLNALNGLDLNHTTVLAKGSELYVPAQP
jgi:LysM repeat protein